MPQSSSAKQSLRNADRKRVFNDRWRKKFRAAIKQVQEAAEKGEMKKAKEILPNTISIIDRATRRHLIPKNAADRKKSQLTKLVSKS